jgi:hypothetical protein
MSKSSGGRRHRKSLANRVTVRLLAEEWNTIKAVIEHGTTIPTDASQNFLLGYHYAPRKQSKQLEKERSDIRKRRDSAITASPALHAEHSNVSYTNSRILHAYILHASAASECLQARVSPRVFCALVRAARHLGWRSGFASEVAQQWQDRFPPPQIDLVPVCYSAPPSSSCISCRTSAAALLGLH